MYRALTYAIKVSSKVSLSMAKTQNLTAKTLPTEPRAGRSIILDAVHPRDFREMNVIYCCEQCSYFDSRKKTCAMGFHVEKHTRENQLKLYHMTGKFAVCRSQEID
jgi:hypothetical protein